MKSALFLLVVACLLLGRGQAFTKQVLQNHRSSLRPNCVPLRARNSNKDEAAIEEEARLRIWESRLGQIRSALKSAESLRNFRIQNGREI